MLAERPLQVGGEPGELLGAEDAEAAVLEVEHVDEGDEVHAGVVEAVVALVVRGLAEAAEVFADGGVGRVVLAGHGVQLGDAQLAEQLLREVELGGLGEVGDVAGVDDQRRLLGHGVDEVDGLGAGCRRRRGWRPC